MHHLYCIRKTVQTICTHRTVNKINLITHPQEINVMMVHVNFVLTAPPQLYDNEPWAVEPKGDPQPPLDSLNVFKGQKSQSCTTLVHIKKA